MRLLKVSTAVTVKIGPFIDDTDGKTAEDALTVTSAEVRLSKNGGNMAAKSEGTALAFDEIGMYDCLLNTTDTNTLGILTINVHESGALPVKQEYMVVPAVIWDTFVGGTDTFDVNVTAMAADVVTNTALAASAVSEIQTGLATAAALDLVDNFLDTEVAAIQAVTVKLDTALELDGAVYRFTLNALEQAPSAGSNVFILHSGTAAAGTIGTITLDGSASASNDVYKYNQIFIHTGTGAGQSRQITAYDGATKIASVEPNWSVTPGVTSQFVIAPLGLEAATLDNIEDAIWDAQRSEHQQVDSFGERVLADVTHVSGNSTAADTIELAYTGSAFTATGWVVPWNAAWDVEVESEVQDAIEANHLDHLLAVAYDPFSEPGHASALLNVIFENDAGVPRFTTNVLENGVGGGGGGGGGGGDGSSYTAIPWNSAWNPEVQREVQEGLEAYEAPTEDYLDLRTLASADYATSTSADAIEADTQDIQSRLPAALENDRMKVKVEQIHDVVLTTGGVGGQSIGGA